MLEKLHIPQFEIKVPALGLLVESIRHSDDEFCFLYTQGVLVYNLKEKSSKSEKFKQQALNFYVSDEMIRIFCKNAEIIEINLKTWKKTEYVIEPIKNMQINSVSISKTHRYFMLETNKTIYFFESPMNLIKKFPNHSFPGMIINEIWNIGDTHFCLLDQEKNLCIYSIPLFDIFYLSHEGFKIYSFHWDRKINTKIFLGKENSIEIFDIHKKEILDIIEGLTSTPEIIDTQPDLGLLAYLENHKIITMNYRRNSNRNENFDKKLKTIWFKWILATYFLIIQDLLTREIFLLDLIENKIMEFKIKENKNFDANSICSDNLIIFQFKNSQILLDLNTAIKERIAQIDTDLVEFINKKVEIPHFLENTNKISNNVMRIFEQLKIYDRCIRSFEFVLEMCDKNFSSMFPRFYGHYLKNPADFHKKYSEAKTELIMKFQIEIESIKNYIAEREQESNTIELFEIKKQMYLLQLLFHNVSKIVDKNPIMNAMPMFDLDDFLF